jgi:hypothetical protein
VNAAALLQPAAIVQNCYVVPDLDEACRQFNAAYGIGPFLGGGEILLEHQVYRGQPAPPVRLRGVFAQSGDMNVELVQILSDGPSAFKEMFAPGAPPALHHVAMFCDSYEGVRDGFVAAGYPVASEFTITAMKADFSYIDTRALNGHFVELYPEHEGIRAMYRQTVEAARTWDRKQLIIPWGA